MLSSLPSPPRGAYPDILASLVAYWPLEEAGGVTRRAALWVPGADPATQLDLADQNTVASVAGPSANLTLGAGFAAASSRKLSVAASAATRLAGKDFTVFGWVFLTTKATGQSFICKETDATHREWDLHYSTAADRFRFRYYDGANILGTAVEDTLGAVSTGTWYFLVGRVIRNPGATPQGQVIANAGSLLGGGGTQASNVANGAGTMTDTTGALQLGFPSSAGGNYLNGNLAHMGICSRALTNREIVWLYNNGQGRDLRKGV